MQSGEFLGLPIGGSRKSTKATSKGSCTHIFYSFPFCYGRLHIQCAPVSKLAPLWHVCFVFWTPRASFYRACTRQPCWVCVLLAKEEFHRVPLSSTWLFISQNPHTSRTALFAWTIGKLAVSLAQSRRRRRVVHLEIYPVVSTHWDAPDSTLNRCSCRYRRVCRRASAEVWLLA